MNRKLVSLGLSLFVAAGAWAAGQQVYKWTDTAGVVHFSDAPPPKDAKDVQLMRVSGGDRPHSVDASNNESGNGSEGGSNAVADNAAPSNPNGINAKACATARNNLDILNSKMPVSVTGPDGKAVPLDEKARAAQIAVANANIDLYCKP